TLHQWRCQGFELLGKLLGILNLGKVIQKLLYILSGVQSLEKNLNQNRMLGQKGAIARCTFTNK
ncbi:hypothetical protein BpHYR1_019383, partial [Brachionus plicatilis]